MEDSLGFPKTLKTAATGPSCSLGQIPRSDCRVLWHPHVGSCGTALAPHVRSGILHGRREVGATCVWMRDAAQWGSRASGE